MTERTLSFGPNRDMIVWDDADSAYGIETDAPIIAPNMEDVTDRVNTVEQNLITLNQDIAAIELELPLLDGRIVTLENDLADGVSGSFTTVDSKTITVVNGRITAIVG